MSVNKRKWLWPGIYIERASEAAALRTRTFTDGLSIERRQPIPLRHAARPRTPWLLLCASFGLLRRSAEGKKDKLYDNDCDRNEVEVLLGAVRMRVACERAHKRSNIRQNEERPGQGLCAD
jgi:hypothetical protein